MRMVKIKSNLIIIMCVLDELVKTKKLYFRIKILWVVDDVTCCRILATNRNGKCMRAEKKKIVFILIALMETTNNNNEQRHSHTEQLTHRIVNYDHECSHR